MGACDGPRRLEPVAPAVGDRPSIGDETRPGQSDGSYGANAPEQGASTFSVTPVRQMIFPEYPTVAARDRRNRDSRPIYPRQVAVPWPGEAREMEDQGLNGHGAAHGRSGSSQPRHGRLRTRRLEAELSG